MTPYTVSKTINIHQHLIRPVLASWFLFYIFFAHCNMIFMTVLSVSCRDVGDGAGHLAGALEAAVAGERDAVLPRVHEQLRAAVAGHAAHRPRTATCPARTHAPAAHLRHGEYWTHTHLYKNHKSSGSETSVAFAGCRVHVNFAYKCNGFITHRCSGRPLLLDKTMNESKTLKATVIQKKGYNMLKYSQEFALFYFILFSM